jgi:acyl carrier protein
MSTTGEPIEQAIRDFISRNLLFSGEGFPYSDDASLLAEGIVDSLGVMELVEFAQQTFQIVISQQEVLPENFDSVNKLAAFIRLKARAQSAAAQR